MRCFMGIDLGTSSVKALIVDERGRALGAAQEGYGVSKPRMEWAEQDIEALWEAARRVAAGAVAAAPAEAEIAGIGYSGQMHGLVALDRAGKPVRETIIWADQRSAGSIEEIRRIIPAEEYRAVSRNRLSTGFLLASLMWVRKHEPENFARIERVLLPKDYIRWRMCGEFATDASDASGTGIFDVAARGWAWDFIDRLGLPRSIFPPCRESCEIVGALTRECAAATGLRAGTPVVCGGGDTPVQALGNGLTGPGMLTANIGTACQLAAILGEPRHDALYRTNTFCHVVDSAWMLMGAHLSGGVVLKWLRDQVFLMRDYDEMTALAERAPAGSEGLLFLPYLSGERTPWNDPSARGVWLGLTLRHGRAHMIRSAMEGIALGLRSSLEIFEELGVCASRVVASGGGARSRLFRQIQADVFGREIYRNASEEQGCTGAALLAAVGVGAFTDCAEACAAMVRFDAEVVEPNRENQKRYEERYAAFKQIYERNRDLF